MVLARGWSTEVLTDTMFFLRRSTLTSVSAPFQGHYSYKRAALGLLQGRLGSSMTTGLHLSEQIL